MPPATASAASIRAWRGVTWFLVALSGYWLVQAIGAGRADDSPGLARGLSLAGLSLLMAGVLGVRAARRRLQVQAVAAENAARMLLVAQLGRQDDATLERVVRTGGPAAEAAVMILRGRHLGNPTGHATRSPLEP